MKNLATGVITQLTDDTATEANAEWSPDGSRIAYDKTTNALGSGSDIFVIDANGTTRRKLTDNTVQDLEPDWNGASIAFRRTNLVGGSTINTMVAVDGGNVVEVVALGGVFVPAFSPDGSRIVYERRAGAAWSIEVLTLGGGTVVIENDGVRNTGPSFSPDGTHVILAKNIDISM